MRKRRYDYFTIWLGLTILGIVILVFFAIIRHRPDFFRSIELVQ